MLHPIHRRNRDLITALSITINAAENQVRPMVHMTHAAGFRNDVLNGAVLFGEIDATVGALLILANQPCLLRTLFIGLAGGDKPGIIHGSSYSLFANKSINAHLFAMR